MCFTLVCVLQQITDVPSVIRHKLLSELWPFRTPFGWRDCLHDYRLTGTQGAAAVTRERRKSRGMVRDAERLVGDALLLLVSIPNT